MMHAAADPARLSPENSTTQPSVARETDLQQESPASFLSLSARLGIMLSVVIFTVALDQGMKAYAVEHWKREPHPVVHDYLGGVFRTLYAENHGAFLSLLSDSSTGVQFWILQVGNAAALLGIAIYLVVSRKLTGWMIAPLVLLLGGGIGNLIDRMRLGYVIDYYYIDLGGPFHTGVFNVADIAITLAFPLLVRQLLWGEKPAAEAGLPNDESSRASA